MTDRDLVTSLRADPAIDQLVRELGARVFERGEAHRVAGNELAARFGFTKKVGGLLVQDEVGTLNGLWTMRRHLEAGIARYRWRTCLDERVSAECAAREGQVFRYDEPPPGGPPGMATLCRCTGEPMFEDEAVIGEAAWAMVRDLKGPGFTR